MADVRRAGRELRLMRERLELTQREVEQRSGVSNGDISRIELGGVARPSMDTLVALGEMYGLDPNRVAELYGYWQPKQTAGDPALERVAHLLDQLSPLDRVRVQGMIELVERAAQEAITR